jgi:hypothetical protein
LAAGFLGAAFSDFTAATFFATLVLAAFAAAGFLAAGFLGWAGFAFEADLAGAAALGVSTRLLGLTTLTKCFWADAVGVAAGFLGVAALVGVLVFLEMTRGAAGFLAALLSERLLVADLCLDAALTGCLAIVYYVKFEKIS